MVQTRHLTSKLTEQKPLTLFQLITRQPLGTFGKVASFILQLHTCSIIQLKLCSIIFSIQKKEEARYFLLVICAKYMKHGPKHVWGLLLSSAKKIYPNHT